MLTTSHQTEDLMNITTDSHDKAFSSVLRYFVYFGKQFSKSSTKLQTQRTHFSSFISSSAASVHSGELLTIFSETNRFSLQQRQYQCSTNFTKKRVRINCNNNKSTFVSHWTV